jgi:hypothetical protein
LKPSRPAPRLNVRAARRAQSRMRLMQSSFERPEYSLSTIYRRKSDVELSAMPTPSSAARPISFSLASRVLACGL